MKIAVIFTGGTIGSCIKDDFIGVDNKMQYVLLKEFENDSDIEFSISSPYSILSENLSANELNLLQKEIAEKLAGNYDGIIVTHGTDTLQYTSTAMEYIFGDAEIPVVFVSANYPLDNENSNGFANFKAAVEFIRAKISKGVFVSYKNQNKLHTTIHIPSHIFQHNECDANIYSIDNSVFATYNGHFTLKNAEYKIHKTVKSVEFKEHSGILVISSVPGQDYSFSLEDVRAILIKSYHSATLNTSSKSFVSLCKTASEKNIPVFVTGTKNGAGYESTRIYNELNIIPLPYSTFISAYVKMWIAISKNDDIKEFMKKQIANEII
ncbi:MAG: asparaginase [Clostridia bacterium]|nr:asparaginase [Clostridia bacterium]